MAGVVPNNYVNTEMVDNYCFDSCEFQYNYQPIEVTDSITNENNVHEISISNPTNYKCKFSGDKYELTNIYIILNPNFMRHSYERYNSGMISGEFIMSHKNKETGAILNMCMAIKGNDYSDEDTMTPLTSTINTGEILKLNKYIASKPYNYYDSENPSNTGGDENTHWVVFDVNQSFILVDNTLVGGDSTGLTTIKLPEAPPNIVSIQYHEKGPQYIEQSKGMSCKRVITDTIEETSSNNGLLRNGIFGQKNPMIVSLLLFSVFVAFISFIMGIGYMCYNNKLNINVTSIDISKTKEVFFKNKVMIGFVGVAALSVIAIIVSTT